MASPLCSTALRVPAGQRLRLTPAFQSAGAKRLHVVSAAQAPGAQEVSRRKTLQWLGVLAAGFSLPQQVLAAGKAAEAGRQASTVISTISMLWPDIVKANMRIVLQLSSSWIQGRFFKLQARC